MNKAFRNVEFPSAEQERGMSVIEVLVAAALLLVISLGILALLTRSLANTNRGWEATYTSNMVRTQLDNHLGQPFEEISIAAADTVTESTAFWAAGSNAIDNDDDEGWYDTEAAAKGLVLMERQLAVRQYNVKTLLGSPTGFNDLGEWEYFLTEAKLGSGLSGSVDQDFVHVKRFEVSYKGVREGGGLGAGQRLKAETFKSF